LANRVNKIRERDVAGKGLILTDMSRFNITFSGEPSSSLEISNLSGFRSMFTAFRCFSGECFADSGGFGWGSTGWIFIGFP